MVRADEGDGDDRGHISGIRPAVARAVLDVGVTRIQRDLRPVVELEGGLS